MKKSYSRILKIEPKGKSVVYDFTVKDTHRILANNFYTSNCDIRHPDAEDFIDAKMETDKITGANVSVKLSDTFINAALNNEKFIQQFPIDSENPIIVKEVEAKKLWNKIIKNAWKRAEPGCLFWDTIIKESVPDCYQDHGFKTISTNPCLTGDVKVAVADGRTNVTIKQLAEEGLDVPVYCLDENNNLDIQILRNPRITGYNVLVYKIKLENGHEIKVTANHKFKLKNGPYVEAKDLKINDSLEILTKYQDSLEEDIFYKSNSKSNDYWRLNNGQRKNILEHEFIYEKLGDLGENNPIFKNAMSSDITKEILIYHGKLLTNNLQRRPSIFEWKKYCINKNLPAHLHFNYRGFANIKEFLDYCSIECGFNPYKELDQTTTKTLQKAILNGYETKIENKQIYIKKKCEWCGKEFWQLYDKREVAFCSQTCSNFYVNKKNINVNNNRNNSIKLNEEENKKYLEIYISLRKELNRNPLLKEWQDKCKELNYSSRLGDKYTFNWKELEKEAEFYNHRIISIEKCGYETVYNGTVDKWHNFFVGEFEELTKNNKKKLVYINNLQCGEITLSAYDSCRLTSMNLYSYVENPFTDKAKFNFDLFKEHVIIAQRLMDDLIDLEIEKIDTIIQKIKKDPEEDRIKRPEIEVWEKIKENTLKGRRTGLGITALGDALAALGLIYGTDEANKQAEKIQKTLAVAAYKSSCLLAKERGAFPVYNYEKEIDNPFIKRLKGVDEELDSLLKKYGRRNIACLTIAPTGTVSLMTQTTSGIECAFLISYKRRRKVNPNDKDVKVTFTDEVGDSWEEYNVFHHKFLDWLEVNGYNIEDVKKLEDEELQKIIKKSPYYKATSADVDWVQKVKMQGMLQKYVDHSISVTVNVPEDTTIETVSKIYEEAWRNGCKGITIYRDGSRSGVLISNNKKEEEKEDDFKQNNSPKRPKELEADYYVANAKGKKFAVIVGLYKGKPYEIFAFENPPLNDFCKGKIVKVKRGHYDFLYNGEKRIENIQLATELVEERAHTIFISMLLRHGAPIKHILNVAKKVDDNITSFSSVVRRILSKYIEDEVLEEKCPECGGTLTRQEGCVKCLNGCGYSKCG